MAPVVINQVKKKEKAVANQSIADADALRTENVHLKKRLAEKEAQISMLTSKIAKHKQTEEKLEYQYQSLLTQLETSPDGVLIEDENIRIFSYNQHFIDLWRFPKALVQEALRASDSEILLNHAAAQASDPEGFLEKVRWIDANKEIRSHDEIKLNNGRFIDQFSAPIISNGKYSGRVWYFRDITERKNHEEELHHVANHDMVTGLPNRRLLTDRLGQAIARAQRNGKMLAVCYLDLDNFKPINDEHGHDTGDQLLVNITRQIKDVLRAEDTLARLGGDEFVLLFNDLESVDDVHVILDRLLATVSARTQIGSLAFDVSASIGVALYPEDHVDADTLLRHADQAMYLAKGDGKNRYHIFDPGYDKQVLERMESIVQLRTALEKGEFVLHFQPKVNLLVGRLTGAEALIRWQHPERGLLSPMEFIHHLDGSDIEEAVGEWVIGSALKQIYAWKLDGLSIPVSVNISAKHLLSADFAERLSQTLERYPDIIPSYLELEIVETAAFSDMSQAFDTLTRCRELGVKVALDDFGTGYSSLTYLRQLPVNTLKIDQSFVRDMLTDPSNRGIVLSVVQLAQTFSREVIAEGVETLEQGEMLLRLGCQVMQGYGFARPMPAELMPNWIQQWREKAIWQKLDTTNVHKSSF